MDMILTGGSGFVGSHYFDTFKNNYNISNYDKKLGKAYDLCSERVTESMPFCDILFHLAATNGTRLFYDNPTDVLINNTLPTINLIKRYINSSTKFVFASTCEIFNSTIDNHYYDVPTDEQVPIMFNDITNPRWSYSIPKALGENLVVNSGLEYIIIRYFNIYGPGQVDHFINEFIDRCKVGEYFINGDDTRSFCYVDDAIKMTDLIINNHSNLTVNIGSSIETPISFVARLIMRIMGIDPELLEIRSSPKGSAIRRCPDTSLVYKLTNFSEYTPLEKGLKNTIESLI